MTFSEIKELHDMGFSTDEIMKLNLEPAKEPEPPKEEPKPEEEVKEEPKPEEEPKTVDDSAKVELAALRKETADLKTEMQKFISAMQKNNLLTASLNMLPADDLDAKTDAALSELIRPTIKEKEGAKK